MQQRERGCLPGTNCCVAVPADRVVAVESCGYFRKLMGPGLGFAGLDLFGRCVLLRSVTLSMEETDCTVSTLTRDREFITAKVLVQYSVVPGKAKDATCSAGRESILVQKCTSKGI